MSLIAIYLLSLFEFTFPHDTIKFDTIPTDKKITVVGRAIERKNVALVMTDDSLRYYLDGISRWDKKYLGKRVEVTGELMVVTYDDPDPSKPVRQTRLGTWRIIKKPKWRLGE